MWIVEIRKIKALFCFETCLQGDGFYYLIAAIELKHILKYGTWIVHSHSFILKGDILASFISRDLVEC